MFIEFDWDPQKADINRRKHGVRFPLAASVLADPLALTRYDDENSEAGDRWVTLGEASNGQLLVVVHTWRAVAASVQVRLISARKANRHEAQSYRNTSGG